ncbi:MAG: nucleotide exchange factor GrpE [Burkholderiales bacterium]|nr:nucleotide exchange factor GrpE [Anaerolineae bacterium]
MKSEDVTTPNQSGSTVATEQSDTEQTPPHAPGQSAAATNTVDADASTDADTVQESHAESNDHTRKVDEMAQLENQLTAAQNKAQEYLEGWQRARAEFANYKKRTERELQERHQNAAVEVLADLLPIIDDFELATSNVPAEFKDHSWVNGVNMIQRKFLKKLEDNGIEIIDPVGEVFDPNRHEAIATDTDTDMESGHITTTLRKGYIYGDRVLRPALVRVAG